MSKPEYLDELIDRASKAAGNDAKLAHELQVTRSTLSQWRHGKKPCPVGDQTLMADLAGLPATEWTARAVAAQYEGTPKGEKLVKALGKALLVTGVVIATNGAHAAIKAGGYLIRCIEGLSYKRRKSDEL